MKKWKINVDKLLNHLFGFGDKNEVIQRMFCIYDSS